MTWRDYGFPKYLYFVAVFAAVGLHHQDFRAAPVLPGGSSNLESLLRDCGRPQRRLEATCGPTSTYGGGCSGSSFSGWFAPRQIVVDGSQSSGVGLQVRQQSGVLSSWRGYGEMGRSPPMGKSEHINGFNGDNHTWHYRDDIITYKKDEEYTCLGPGRRDGVRCGGRWSEVKMAASVCEANGISTPRGRRAKRGADVCICQAFTGKWGSSLCRFLGVGAVRKEGLQSVKVQSISSHAVRGVHHEGDPRTVKLCAMASFVQSLQNSYADGGSCELVDADGLRSTHREVHQVVSDSMALGGISRRPSKKRSHREDQAERGDGYRSSKTSTTRLEQCKTLGWVFQVADRGCKLLEHTGAEPGGILVGPWIEGSATHSSRVGGRGVNQRWSECNHPGSRGQEQLLDTQEAGKQREERGKEEEVEGGKGRVDEVPKWKRWKRPRRYFERRQRKFQGRSTLLLVEQWEWTLCGLRARGGMQKSRQASSQMHSMWIPKSPIEVLSIFIKRLKAGAEILVHAVTKEDESGKSSSTIPGGIFSWAGASSSEVKQEEMGRKEERSDEKRNKRKREGDKDDKEQRDRKGEDEKNRKIIYNGKEMDFSGFRKARVFRFVHHYAGENDRLSMAIRHAANDRDIAVETISVEKKAGRDGNDLLANEPYHTHLQWAKEGRLDAYHSGFPCKSFSRLRWRKAEGMPPPVRSKLHPNGLPGNTPKQQKEADEGSIMMARSINITKEMVNTSRRVHPHPGAPATMENPPESNHAEHVSVWEMADMVEAIKELDLTKVYFNTCAYQPDVPVGERFYKPQVFAGSLHRLASLLAVCRCGDASHRPVVGKETSEESGSYPFQLCMKYADLLMDHFEKVLQFEFIKMKKDQIAGEVQQLQERSKRVKKQEPSDSYETYTPDVSPSVASMGAEEVGVEKKTYGQYTMERERGLDWIGGRGKHGLLKESTKQEDRPDKQAYVGGMRHPARVVRLLPGHQNFGLRLWGAWKRFASSRNDITEVAVNYGTAEAKFSEQHLHSWKAELKRLTGAKAQPAVVLKDNKGYKSPLDPNILEGWIRRTSDPEGQVVDWIREGAPLGIERPIHTSGIFPPSGEVPEGLVESDSLAQLALGPIANYSSVSQHLEHAEEELQRLEEMGYMFREDKEEIMRSYGHGTISKLGLILKEKEDGSLKKRLVIDLRRSKGNSKAKLPEKLVLPRPWDAVEMLRDLRQGHPGLITAEETKNRWGLEMALVDVSDAFMTLAVHRQEWPHTVTPTTVRDEYCVFCALLFGFKTAPLLYSRVAALLARCLQSAMDPSLAMHQVYLDDSLWGLQGTLQERNLCLTFILYTMAALGFRIALHKGIRAASVTWVGVRFQIMDINTVVVSLPEKFIMDLVELLKSWHGRGMVASKELRSVAGRTSWLAGVLPRSRWVVSVFYATLMDADREERRQREEGSATRDKSGLFYVKRLESARLWLVGYLEAAGKRPHRRMAIGGELGPQIKLMTDASPEALGGILMVNGRVVAAFSSKVTTKDAEELMFKMGESSSQAIVEALAVLQGIKLWRKKIEGTRVTLVVQSDSVVALTLIEKKANSSVSLNFLGACLSISLEEASVERVKTMHIPGAANLEADWLSRPSKWSTEPVPTRLRNVNIAKLEGRDPDFWDLPTPGQQPDLWGITEESVVHSVWTSIR